MEGSGRKPASFATQTNALMRKNLVLQKRNYKTNICVIVFPILLIVLLAYLQSFISGLGKKLDIKCPCDTNGRPIEATFAGICASGMPFLEPSLGCIVPSPQKWPPLLKVPRAEFRAVNVPFMPFKDLPSEGCRKTKFCPVTFLVTGGNRSFTESLSSNMFSSLDLSGKKGGLPDRSDLVLATTANSQFSTDENVNFMDDAFAGDESGPIYILQPKCLPNATLMIPFKRAKIMTPIVATCAEALTLWRDDIATIEKEMYQGYPRGNRNNMTNEIAYAFDLLNSSKEKYNVTIRYNATIRDNTMFDKVETAPNALRVPRAINLASNAYLKLLKGKDVKMQFEFLNEMPQLARPFAPSFDIATKMGELFFAYLLQLLFPVMVGYLVHEKQGKTRIMMKMHGLGDGPYWLISYGYFFVLSCLYMLCCWFFGRLVGLSFFTLNSGKLQLVFYFASMNLQIAFAILVSALFSRARTATVTSYVYIFGIGILGFSYFHGLSDTPFMKGNLTILMELIPGLSLYRGVYELSQYAFSGFGAGAYGIQWSDLKDDINGMKTILIIMAIEWILFLFISIYFDRDVSNPEQGTGKCNPFSFLFHPKRSTKLGQSFSRLNKNTTVDMDRPDVIRERELVEDLLKNPNDTYSVVCDNIVKVHKGQDGNPDKVAVKGLSLALPRGECFGMLGPNGAGKTTLLSMLTGFLKPTSGTAYISGLDIRVDMNKIYSGIGVCPQHDLLWETLTAREHLMFYGRLKNLTGSTLAKAVNDSLESVNLQGVADKQAGQYSGGMKRRLSVAIALIGDSNVVYLDEPSTGLDPASRKALWKAIMQAKHDRAIILTTHSMEEAEFLCDRLGIFVDGSLQCVGNANELKAKFGGLYILTITSSPEQDGEVENLVKKLAPNSKKTYHIAGTQKFEMAKEGVKLSRVFELMEHMKKRVNIIAWGVADTNLEDVFIKVARNADAFSSPK